MTEAQRSDRKFRTHETEPESSIDIGKAPHVKRSKSAAGLLATVGHPVCCTPWALQIQREWLRCTEAMR